MAAQKDTLGLRVVTMSRDEYIADIAYAANAEGFLPFPNGTFPNDRFAKGIQLDVQFTATMPAANNPTSVNADAPYSILDMIEFGGQHRPRAKDETFYKVRGATAYYLQQLYGGYIPRTDITVNDVAAAAMSVAANAVNKVRFTIEIPFVPQGISAQEQLGYLLDLPNYDFPKLKIKFGDAKSMFSGGDMDANPVVISDAKVSVTGVFVMAGADRFAGFVPARVYRIQQGERTSGVIVDGGNAQRLFDLPKGFAIRNVLAISGVRDTTVSAGNFAFATRSNAILSNIRINQGIDKPIRKYASMYGVQDSFARAYASTPVSGYGVIDFAKHGRLFEALPTRQLIGGTDGDTDLYLSADVAAGANQAMSFVVEEIRYSPNFPKLK